MRALCELLPAKLKRIALINIKKNTCTLYGIDKLLRIAEVVGLQRSYSQL